MDKKDIPEKNKIQQRKLDLERLYAHVGWVGNEISVIVDFTDELWILDGEELCTMKYTTHFHYFSLADSKSIFKGKKFTMFRCRSEHEIMGEIIHHIFVKNEFEVK